MLLETTSHNGTSAARSSGDEVTVDADADAVDQATVAEGRAMMAKRNRTAFVNDAREHATRSSTHRQDHLRCVQRQNCKGVQFVWRPVAHPKIEEQPRRANDMLAQMAQHHEARNLTRVCRLCNRECICVMHCLFR